MSQESMEGGAAPIADTSSESAAVTESPVTSTSEAPSSPSPTSGGETNAAATTQASAQSEAQAPNFPSYDDFGWDNWAGEVSSLPEQIQPWAQKVYDQRTDWTQKQISEGLAEATRIKDIYNALLDGHDDPRYGELEKKHGDLQSQLETLTRSSEESAQEYATFRKEVEAAVEAESTRYAEWFQAQYGDLFDTPEAVAKLEGLLNSGWEIGQTPQLMALPEEALEIASAALRDGVPAKYAVQLANKAVPAKAAPAKPRPAARITSGATSAPATPNQLKHDGGHKVRTLDDMRHNAAHNALKRHTSGRR
jgi:hypothetical protein